MQLILIFCLSVITQFAYADAVIFSGADVKALKYNLDLFGRSKVMGLASDPTSGGGQAAPLGSIGMDYLTGAVYIKKGATATDWVDITGSITGTANTAAAYDANGVLNPVSAVSVTELGYLDGVLSSLCGISDSCILTNKTIDADVNTISDIDNGEIKAGAAIDATKIADGSVTSTEFQYINTLSSNAQTQLDGKASTTLNNLGTTAINASLTFASGVAGSVTTASASPSQAITFGSGNGSSGGANSGNVTLQSGVVSGAANSGNIAISTGTALGGSAGSITLSTGQGSGSSYGTITLEGGQLTSIGQSYIFNARGANDSVLSLANSTENFLGLAPSPSMSLGYNFVFPADDGTNNGDVLQTNGAGTTSWIQATDQNTSGTIVKRDSGSGTELNLIKRSNGSTVYNVENGQINSITGTLIADHSGTNFNSYWPILFGNVTNNIGGPQVTLRTPTTAAGGTSHTVTWANSNANGVLVNDGAGQMTWKPESNSGAFNYIQNYGWEGVSTSWTASGGSYARTTTAADIGTGVGAGQWDSNASSQTLTSTAVALTAGAYGRNGVVSCAIETPSGTATHLLQAWDGTNVLASQTITSSTNFSRTNVNFVFPSSGSISARIVSVNSNEPSINIDDCYLGLAEGFNVSQVSQASFYGALNSAPVTNCAWTRTGAGSDSFANFSADTDCSTPTVAGFASAPATKIPGITFTTLPPGEYQVVVSMTGFKSGSVDNSIGFRISDGTNTTSAQESYPNTNQLSAPFTLMGRFSYTTAQSNITFQVQGVTGSTSNSVVIPNDAAGKGFTINVYRFPTSSETAIAANQSGWYVAATMEGANVSLGTADVTSYTEMTNGSLTLTKATGSAAVGIACASGTASVVDQTACSSNESIGITFNVPAAGAYNVCSSFSHFYSSASATAAADVWFQLSETSASSSTIVQNGLDKGGTLSFLDSTITQNRTTPLRVCSVFNFSSAGQKTVRLMYEQDASGTPTTNVVAADGSATYGQRNVAFTVTPVNTLMQSPILVGSVTSNSTGAERVERANVNCDATPTTNTESGDWVSSVTQTVSGDCTVNFTSGMFSGTPTCTATTVWGAGGYGFTTIASVTSSAIRVQTFNAVGTLTNADYSLICMGPR